MRPSESPARRICVGAVLALVVSFLPVGPAAAAEGDSPVDPLIEIAAADLTADIRALIRITPNPSIETMLQAADLALTARMNEVGDALDGKLNAWLAQEKKKVELTRTLLGISRDDTTSRLDKAMDAASAALEAGRSSSLEVSDLLDARDAAAAAADAQFESSRLILAILERTGIDEFTRGVALAMERTRAQAEAMGLGWREPDRVSSHRSPSEAALALLDANDVTPSARQRARIRRLDDLARPVASSLTRFIDAFIDLQSESRAAFADFDMARIERADSRGQDRISSALQDLEQSVSSIEEMATAALQKDEIDIPELSLETSSPRLEEASRVLVDAGVDLSAVFPARNALLDATVSLRNALAATSRSSPQNAAPVQVPPVLSIDLSDDANTYTEDFMLVVDKGGDDRYLNNAGGNNVLLHGDCRYADVGAAGALVDLGGNDDYTSRRSCGAKGGGRFGVGFLVDGGGNDVYSRNTAVDDAAAVATAEAAQARSGEQAANDAHARSIPTRLAHPEGHRVRLIVGFRADVPDLAIGDEYQGASVVFRDPELRFIAVTTEDPDGFLAQVRDDQSILYVEKDHKVEIASTPDDPLYRRQYAPQQVNLPQAWDTTLGKTTKNVCVVDTGIYYRHEELNGFDNQGRYLGGYDFVNEDDDPVDDNGHGSHVAGIAAASTNNGRGIAGAAQVGILATKVLDKFGSGFVSWVASGIRWCADNGGDVVNLSVGTSLPSTTLENAVVAAAESGSLVVAAAGNSGCFNCVSYPAAYEEAVAVSCVEEDRSRCWFTNTGNGVELAAPGYDILSLYKTSMGYISSSGTSMSTPLVSGVASLVWSEVPELTASEVRQLLRDHAQDDGAPGCDEVYGNGIVDAAATLAAALSGARPAFDPNTRCAAGVHGVNGGGNTGAGFLLDIGGDDTYLAGSGGTNGGAYQGTGLLVDLGGSDSYDAPEAGTNGGGYYGSGSLIDTDGDDSYRAWRKGVNGGGIVGSGFLLDRAGSDSYVAAQEKEPLGAFVVPCIHPDGSCGVNGGGTGGTGFLLDGGGADEYRAGSFGANGGAGSNGSTGLLIDGGGDDAFLVGGYGANGGALGIGARALLVDAGGHDVYRSKKGVGANGAVNQGTAGQLIDLQGDDAYAAGRNGANGGTIVGAAAAFGSGGFLFDAGGDDSYRAGPYATNGGGVFGAGFLADAAGNDSYEAGFNATNGGGVLAGVGFLADGSGNDSYSAGTTNAGSVAKKNPDDGSTQAEPQGSLQPSSSSLGGAEITADGRTGRYIVGFGRVAPELERGNRFHGAVVVAVNQKLRFVAVTAPNHDDFVDRVRVDPRVRYVEDDRRVSAAYVPDDPEFSKQYGPQQVNAPGAWNRTMGDASKNVCVVDSGVRYTHEDLTERYVRGHDFIAQRPYSYDHYGHGTHVAGIAAASVDNGKGIAGIANVGILSAKVLDDNGRGFWSDVASGIQWCADTEGHVINLSIGGLLAGDALREAVEYAWGKGSLLVAAAGNYGCYDCIQYSEPQAFPEVIPVTCTTEEEEGCWFSSTGPEAELAAPGNDILSTYISGDSSYRVFSGTSMSAPHVSGVAALVWSKSPDLTNKQLRQLLRDNARRDFAEQQGDFACDEVYGYGIVDAKATLDAALRGDRPALRASNMCASGSFGTNGGGYVLGAGFLLDGAGNDAYNAGSHGVNGAGVDAIGLLVDAAGDDNYSAGGVGANGAGVGRPSSVGIHFQGQSVVVPFDLLGGGLLLDGRGGDRYWDQDGGTGTDRTVVPKGRIGKDREEGLGAQLDLEERAAYRVTVAVEGTGRGRVTSSPRGIDCGERCSDMFPAGSSVTLRAKPDGDSVFSGWSGACSGAEACELTMDSDKEITALFDPLPIPARLVVERQGDGSGTVTSAPAGIDCGDDCRERYDRATSVELVATSAEGSLFAGWSGDCLGTGGCTLTMDGNRNVAATFELLPDPLPTGQPSATPSPSSTPPVRDQAIRRARTERVSVATDGKEQAPRSGIYDVSISADGRYAVFSSSASNLVPGDSNGGADVFVRDLRTGETRLVSISSGEVLARNQDSPYTESSGAVTSADGRFVAFRSNATNLVSFNDQNRQFDVFVHDRDADGDGIFDESGGIATEMVSLSADGLQGDAFSGEPSISADGRYVAFNSEAGNLVPGDTNGQPPNWNYPDVFVHDRKTGDIERVSVASDGTQGNYASRYPSISDDGRYVAFISESDNFVPDDTHGYWDVFVHDRETRKTERVSIASDGGQAKGHSGGNLSLGVNSAATPSISSDGRYVAFTSWADNLVPADTNYAADAFVHDRVTGRTELVSTSATGEQGNSPRDKGSYYPSISGNGRWIAFQSMSTNLVADDTNGKMDVFLHDRMTGDIERLSVSSIGSEVSEDVFRSFGTPALTDDGRYTVFASVASDLVPGDNNNSADAFVRDRGPQVGIGEINLVEGGADSAVVLSGWANFLGVVPSAADDEAADADGSAQLRNLCDGDDLVRKNCFTNPGELLGATVAFRPERGDLLVRLALDKIVPVKDQVVHDGGRYYPVKSTYPLNVVEEYAPIFTGIPGMTYGLTFEYEDQRYELRAEWFRDIRPEDPNDSIPSKGDHSIASHFALYRCEGESSAVCTELTGVQGGYGSSGEEVRINLPLEDIGTNENSSFTGLTAFSAAGTARIGAVDKLDEVVLPNIKLDPREVALGIVPAGTPQDEVIFDTPLEITAGESFRTDLDPRSLPAGDYDVWVQACLGEQDCGAASVALDDVQPPTLVPTLTPTPSSTPTAQPAAGVRQTYPVEPDDVYFIAGDSDGRNQWGVTKIQAPEAWQETRSTGYGIRVAVIDTGVDIQHEDLQCPGKLELVAGSNVIDGSKNPDDKYGQGTHVAGIIGACTNNRTGIAGVAPDSTLMPFRVRGADGWRTVSSATAVRRAANAGAHIIALGDADGILSSIDERFSLGTWDEAIDHAVSKGAVVVARAGEASSPFCSHPAWRTGVICVGATDSRDVKAAYSSSPHRLEGDGDPDDRYGIMAPGGIDITGFCRMDSEDILSLWPLEYDGPGETADDGRNGCDDKRPGYYDRGGEEMAVAHVAGVAALIYDRIGGNLAGARNEENSRRVIKAVLKNAVDLGAPGPDPVYGMGRVNALLAVTSVDASTEPDPDPTSSASPAPSATPSKSPVPTKTFEAQGHIDYFNPTTNVGGGITENEFVLTCATPSSQGLDGYVFDIPAAFGAGMGTVDVTGTNDASLYDLDVYFYSSECKYLEEEATVTPEPDETGPIPEGTRFVVVDQYLGVDTDVALIATAPEASASPSPSATSTPTPDPTSPVERGDYSNPDDTFYIEEDKDGSNQWGPQKINAPGAWNKNATGLGTLVAVVDSGVDLLHEDLQCEGKLVPGASVINGKIKIGASAQDNDGHGTHVAGIIGACTNNGTGIAGVAPDATILPVRVFASDDEEDGSVDDIATGVRFAADSGAHVINLSLSVTILGAPGTGVLAEQAGLVEKIDDAIEYARGEGAVVVAAAGNDSFPLCSYPAISSDVICVGATDPRDVKSWYSAFPNKPDRQGRFRPAVVAPGGTGTVFCDFDSEDVLSLYATELDRDSCDGRKGYADLSGTSMAAPHVSGVAALAYDALGAERTAKNAGEVIDAVITSAADLGPDGYDPAYGYGRVDAVATITAVSGTIDPDPTESPTESPSESPTSDPSESPTSDPSESPTSDPSESPTSDPSESPTSDPSESPSDSPSPEPASADVTFSADSVQSGQYSDQTVFEARLSDSASGSGLAGEELTFELTGEASSRTFSAVTDSDGVAAVSPMLEEKPGAHQVTVRFAGDEDHAGAADTMSFMVEKEDTALEVSVHGEDDEKTLRARLSDLDTAAQGVAGRTINFYSDGEPIGAYQTDADGVASVPVPPRHRGANRTYKADYEGDDFYLGSSAERPGKDKGQKNNKNGSSRGADRDDNEVSQRIPRHAGRVRLM